MLHPISVLFVLACIAIYFYYFQTQEKQPENNTSDCNTTNLLKDVGQKPNSLINILEQFNRKSLSLKRISLE
jgi:prephenate dehydratase